MPADRFKRVDVVDTITNINVDGHPPIRETAEFELFLSFHDDEGMLAFEQWLNEEGGGWDLFTEYLHTNGMGHLLD